ncbi:MAG: tRNA (pseudouridine(54)-N(1))-methyltransferase TrmY [Methanomassiliicoccales archaeon]
MREFVLYSRTGRTDGRFTSLYQGGRLDVVFQCLLMSLYISYALRHDVIFHAILNGPPDPPKELVVEGSRLKNAPPDERSWEVLLRGVLSGKQHPGVEVRRNSLQSLIRDREDVFVLEKDGEDIRQVELGHAPMFVIGDQIGLPKKEEEYVLRYGKRVSLGHREYTAAQCVCIINYILDLREVGL